MASLECKGCGEQLEAKNEKCDKCGMKTKKSFPILLLIIIFTIVLSCTNTVFK